MSHATLEVIDHGQIKRMVLPPDWREGERVERVVGNSSLRQFHPSDNDSVTLYFYYRGHDLADHAAGRFRDTLRAPEHRLSLNEMRALAVVVGEKADPDQFSVADARTASLNGRNVLLVEGHYRPVDERSLSIYIDADWSGRFVQEIVLKAPAEQYDRHADVIKATLRAIEWV